MPKVNQKYWALVQFIKEKKIRFEEMRVKGSFRESDFPCFLAQCFEGYYKYSKKKPIDWGEPEGLKGLSSTISEYYANKKSGDYTGD